MPAKSKSQRRLFGLALSYKRGEANEEVSDDVKKLSELPEKTLKKYASTPEKELPENLNIDNISGMGDVSFPEKPKSLNNFSDQEPGSGDTPINLENKKKKDKKIWLLPFNDFINEYIN